MYSEKKGLGIKISTYSDSGSGFVRFWLPGSGSLHHQANTVRKTLISTVLKIQDQITNFKSTISVDDQTMNFERYDRTSPEV
jgi:hypothetical protein